MEDESVYWTPRIIRWIGRKLPVLVIIFSIVFIMYYGTWMFNQFHESAHKEIFKTYGMNATVVNPFWGGLKNFVSNENTGDKPRIYTRGTGYGCTEDCDILHEMNEVIGYSVAGLIYNLWLMVLVFTGTIVCFVGYLMRRERESIYTLPDIPDECTKKRER